jgi:hypothetical protein
MITRLINRLRNRRPQLHCATCADRSQFLRLIHGALNGTIAGKVLCAKCGRTFRITFAAAAAAVALLAFSICGQDRQAASTGPTTLVITNDLQFSATADGPWQTIQQCTFVAYLYPTNHGFYRSILHSSTPIPH